MRNLETWGDSQGVRPIRDETETKPTNPGFPMSPGGAARCTVSFAVRLCILARVKLASGSSATQRREPTSQSEPWTLMRRCFKPFFLRPSMEVLRDLQFLLESNANASRAFVKSGSISQKQPAKANSKHPTIGNKANICKHLRTRSNSGGH